MLVKYLLVRLEPTRKYSTRVGVVDSVKIYHASKVIASKARAYP